MSARFGLVLVSGLILSGAFACSSDDDDDGGSGGQGGSGGSFGGTGGDGSGDSVGGSGGTGGQATGGTGGGSGGSAGDTSGGAGAGAGGEAGGGGQGGAPGDCPLPDAGLLAVFEVEGQEFRVQLLDATAIADAIALYRGESQANIPNGRLICEPSPYNCNHGWHLDPADTHFAEITIELCDGTPSYVEENCDTFGERYCSWGAELIELYDCRQEGCPSVE
jgi:hypothetical protein